MQSGTRNLTHYLNLVLIIAILSSLLPPPARATSYGPLQTENGRAETPPRRPSALPGELVFNGTFDTTISGWSNENPACWGGAGPSDIIWDNGGTTPGRLKQYQGGPGWTCGWSWQTVQIPLAGLYRLSANYGRYPAGDCTGIWPSPWVSLGGVTRLTWGQAEEGDKTVDLMLSPGLYQLALATGQINTGSCIYGYWDNVSLRPVGNDLPAEQTYSPNECPISACGNTSQHFVGGPINTYSGNYTYQTTDFSITAIGRPLRFERTYNSLPVTGTVVYT